MATMHLKDSNFELLPDGVYELCLKEIVEGTPAPGGVSKDPFLRWVWDVVGPQEAIDNGIKSYSNLTPAGFGPKSKHFVQLIALGFDVAEADGEKDLDLDIYIGQTVIAEIHTVVGVQNKKERNEFKNIWSIEAFQALQNKMQSVGKPKTAATPPATPPAPTRTATPPVTPPATPPVTPPVRKSILNTTSAVDDFPA